jgi:hypothetical protein
MIARMGDRIEGDGNRFYDSRPVIHCSASVRAALFDYAGEVFGIAGDERFSGGIDDEVQVFQNQHADQNAVAIGFAA